MHICTIFSEKEKKSITTSTMLYFVHFCTYCIIPSLFQQCYNIDINHNCPHCMNCMPSCPVSSFIALKIIAQLGVFNFTRRWTDPSAYDIKVSHERFSKAVLLSHSCDTLMSYADRSVWHRMRSNTPQGKTNKMWIS